MEDGIFLDCSLTYNGEPVRVLSGLEHLEGENITLLADGLVIENVLVENGSVHLNSPVSKVVAGLPYEFEMETLNLEGENTSGLVKIVNSIDISVDKSREDFFIVGSDGTMIQNLLSRASLEDKNYLHSGNVRSFSFADYSENATVHIKQIHPFPLTLNSPLSVSINVESRR